MTQGSKDPEGLPYVDEHTFRIAASREQVWRVLLRDASTLGFPEESPIAKVLGTEPASGFAISESVPDRLLVLTGRHRFSRYELTFELSDAPGGGTGLRAVTHAAFPGLHGRIYRTLVIGTRFHVIATNHILRSIRSHVPATS